MTSCAVPICKNYSRKTGKNVRYHRFPKDEGLCKIWIEKCNRIGQIDPKKSAVCSAHFTKDDYERDLKGELLNLPLKRVLKNGAVPSVLLSPADADQQPKTCDIVDEQESQEGGLNNKLCPNDEVNSETDCKVFITIENPMLFDNSVSGTVLTVAQFPKLCRLCLSKSNNASIFKFNYEGLDFRSIFETCCAIQIQEGDGFPENICSNCINEIIRLHQFRLRCQQSNEILKDILCYETKFSAKNNANNETQIFTVQVMEEDENSLSSSESEESSEESKRIFKNVSLNKTNVLCKNNGKSDRESFKDGENSSSSIESEQTSRDSNEILDIPEDVANVGATKINTKRSSNVREKHKRFLPVCSKCDLKFGDFRELLKHCCETGHAKPENCKCELCEKSFCNDRGLDIHRRTAHNEKRYLCSACGKSFFTSGSLQLHLKVHTGDKPYSCDICKKSFIRSGNLRIHQVVHKSDKPYLCKLCDASFKLRRHLNRHMKVHSGEKPHSCNFCEKKFALKETLKVHVRTHTGETPYACDICGIRFCQTDHKKKHMKVHDRVKVGVK